jgi:hypothetical protein
VSDEARRVAVSILEAEQRRRDVPAVSMAPFSLASLAVLARAYLAASSVLVETETEQA